jgi:alpha/beta hydrolase fold
MVMKMRVRSIVAQFKLFCVEGWSMYAKRFIQIAVVLPYLCVSVAMSQTTDTKVDVGGNHLNFHVIKGRGMPILFEAGGGDDSTVWRDILPPLADITHATLIAYDRPGFGKSGLDPNRHGIVNGVDDLDKGLKALGYDGNVMLVAHSLGGFYAELYAAKHPDRVKSIVLIDATESCFLTREQLDINEKTYKDQMAGFKTNRPGVYYLLSDYRSMADVMQKTAFPSSVPVIDIVSDHPPFPSEAERQHWKNCHQQFASSATNREGILASGTGHYIFHDNPVLVINAIVKAYADTLNTEQRSSLLERSLLFNLKEANQTKNP